MPISFSFPTKFESASCGFVRAATYKVESAELGGGLVQAGVGREDRAATLTLVPDNPTHGDGVVWKGVIVERVVDAAWGWRLCAKRNSLDYPLWACQGRLDATLASTDPSIA